jgi:peptide subunit release factor RF-3
MTRLLASDTTLRFFTRGLKMKGLRQGSELAVRSASQVMGQAINNVVQSFDPAQLGLEMEGTVTPEGMK